MPAGRQRFRRRLTALLAVTLLAALGGGGLAWGDSPGTSGSSGSAGSSSTTGTPDQAGGDLTTQFGGYTIDNHAEGLTITYTSPGLIPGTPDTLGALDLPEALTNMDNSPSGYALASLAYPGPLLADLPSALALAGIPNASSIPSYPIRTQAYYPSGPTTGDQSFGSGRQVVSTDGSSATAQASYGAVQLNAVMSAGSITSASQSQVLQGQVVSRSRVQVSGLDILEGLVHIGTLTTDLVATSDGTTSSTAGTTTLSDVTLLGLPATIDETGVHLQPAASTATSATSSPTTTAPANPLLAPLSGALQPVANGLSSLLQTAFGTVNAGVNALLNQGGIDLRLMPATETKSGAEASRLAGGLSLTLNYDGSTEPVMSQLLALIPTNQLPSQGLGPIPFTSPQALVQLLKATHIIYVGLGAANVHAVASPPFTFPSSSGAGGSSGSGEAGGGGDLGSPGTSSGSGGSFSTPVPALPTASHSRGGTGVGTARPAGFLGATPLAAAAGILVALLVALAFGFGSKRMADDVLATSTAGCPEGLERPPDPWSPT